MIAAKDRGHFVVMVMMHESMIEAIAWQEMIESGEESMDERGCAFNA